MNILLWGCGERCKYILDKGYLRESTIIGFIDGNKNIKEFCGKKVFSPEDVLELRLDYEFILVTTKDRHISEEIYQKINRLDYPMEKVVFIYNTYPIIKNREIHNQDEEKVRSISESLYQFMRESNHAHAKSLQPIYKCGFDCKDLSSVLRDKIFNDPKYHLDYMRYRTFELIANEIEGNKISGALAELGVFKGDFSRLINKRFPERKLYLYDSFESFKTEEFEFEDKKENYINQRKDDFREMFTYTSADAVLKSMPHMERCILRKGYFPESIGEEDEKEYFAFVSLDVDLEAPMYEGLRFFYPRLSDGGYIFIHDYNSSLWEGVKRAVRRYEIKEGIRLKKVPISDQCGTLIIIK